MIINLTPNRTDEPQPTITVAGDVLTVNDVVFDLSQLGEGDRLPSDAVDSHWVVESDITRTGGDIVVTLLLPIGPDAPEESRFPAPSIVNSNGPVTLPSFGEAPAEDEA